MMILFITPKKIPLIVFLVDATRIKNLYKQYYSMR